jgi:glycosyltransferase involved in cell wall biosynthesis
MSSIAFIIPHMGREALLLETLASIAKLKHPGLEISVVVVSKNESFSEALLAYKSVLEINFIKVDLSVTISDQRNIGVEHVKAEYLAFIDADIELSPNWIVEMLALVGQPDIVLASAIQLPSKSPSQLEHVRVLLSNLTIDCEMEFLPGRNLLLSYETFGKSGGFPSELVTCEDYVFTQKVSEQGKLYYSSKASYVHLGEDKEYWPMAKKEVWRGQSNLASVKGRKVPVSEYPSFIAPPLFTLGLLWACIFALFGQFPIAAIGFVGAMFILLVYTFRLWKKQLRYPSLFAIVGFYALYFPARTIGTVLGALKTLDSGVYK